MAKQKGQISLRFTDTPSGTVASIVYRGPAGKRVMRNMGFVDLKTPEGTQVCIDALDDILTRRKRIEQASG